MAAVSIPFLGVITENRLVVKLREKAQVPETQRRLVLVIVCIALMLDNMLYMVIVPIIPVFLAELNDDGGGATGGRLKFAEGATYYMYKGEALSVSQVMSRNLTDNPGVTKVSPDLLRDLLGWTAHTHMKGADFADSSSGTSNSVGLLFASKAIVQLFISPFAGPIIDRMGYERPMIVGLSVLFLSTTIFAFGTSYGVLLVARSLQGVGSAFADTAGLAMIADRFKEPGERSKAQGIALAFISFGSLFAPPFGGFLYEFAGKAVPFLALSLIALVDGAMLLFVMKPNGGGDGASQTPTLDFATEKKSEPKLHGTPIYRLIMDPYIAICAGGLVVANVNLAFLEPTIATWMKASMNAEEWKIGLVWLPAFFPHVLGVYVTVKLIKLFPKHQWLITAVGLVLEGASCIFIPFCSNYALVILPLMVDCFGIALVDTAILPTLAYLVDVRHVSVYGSVYAIADVSYSLAYAFGPVMADWIYNRFSFLTLNIVIFVTSLLYAPVLIMLKNVYKYDNLDCNEDEEGNPANTNGGGTCLKPTGYALAATSEAKPFNPTGDYRSYMMNTLPTSENGGTAIGEQEGLTAATLQQPPQQQQQRPSIDDDVNRKYVHVGRARSRDSTEDNGEYRTYR